MFPIEGQKYYKPGPYSMIDSDWFWCRHTNSKPTNKKEEVKDVEEDLLIKIDDMINQEENLSEESFSEKIKSLNSLAWNKSYEMIK